MVILWPKGPSLRGLLGVLTVPSGWVLDNPDEAQETPIS